MRSAPLNDRRRSGRSVAFVVAAVLLGAPLARAGAQGGILIQGILDGELWATDSASPLLTRNGGRPGVVGRMQLWSAVEPWRGVFAFAQGQVEAGTARDEPERVEVYLEQAGVRLAPSRAFMIEGGKMPNPVGAFASRRFSTRNPLIGAPDAYPVAYPWGAQISGATRFVDYRAALVSQPFTHEDYVPDASPRLRPALGAGFTPAAGIRIGASATWGSYLNDSLAPALLAGRPWQDYNQRILAFDAEVSRGYLETHAELARGTYDVPGAGAIDGIAYYLEAKYTFTPRFYVAARVERNDYPFIDPVGDSLWRTNVTDLRNAEGGVGIRLSATRLLKITYRADQWAVAPPRRRFLRDGRAMAFQVSQAFDVTELLRRTP